MKRAHGQRWDRYDRRGIDALAIVLMHGWRHPQHETQLTKIARELGFAQVSVSHEVAPLIKLVGRGDTTVVDAYLSPVLRRYVDRVAGGLPHATDLHFMQSNGGLAEARAFRGKDAILSGPAGGVVGMVAASAPHGSERLIGFDMGGTSTDVSHYAGTFELADESVVAGVRIRAPMMQIHTVAAGGGSICRFDGMRFRVGPESAGANPGPACYRNGGPLTVTDCNLFLGRIDPAQFPAVFGPGGNQPLDADDRARAFRRSRISSPARRASRRLPRGSSTLRSTIWPLQYARSRSREGMTSPATRSPASGARADNTPAASPTRSAWSASWFIRSRACFRPMGSESPT